MAAATQTAAKKNPSQKFTIVDFTYSPSMKNVLGLYYATNQDAFMGGYLAAAMSKTGIVGTFGGQNIPPVTIYMDGWVAGVRYYDKINHKRVRRCSAGPRHQAAQNSLAGKGLFTNDFINQPLGKTDAQTLISQGADIIFPVAGSVGLGAAAAVKQAGAGHYMEWVDTDGCVSAPQYCKLFITSVTKGIAASVSAAVEEAAKGTFKGGNYTGDLADNGVALSPVSRLRQRDPGGSEERAEHDQGWDHRRQDFGRPQLVPGQLTRCISPGPAAPVMRPGREPHGARRAGPRPSCQA